MKAARPTCSAKRNNGIPCQALAVTGELFCARHLKNGYGLFTLAVRRARERLRSNANPQARPPF